jgi:hypothetical protein
MNGSKGRKRPFRFERSGGSYVNYRLPVVLSFRANPNGYAICVDDSFRLTVRLTSWL